MCSLNYETLKEMIEDQNKWKIIMFMSQKTSHHSDGNNPQMELQTQYNPLSESAHYFVEIDMLILKFIQKCKLNKMAKEQSQRTHAS